jgi:hypothetical protein
MRMKDFDLARKPVEESDVSRARANIRRGKLPEDQRPRTTADEHGVEMGTIGHNPGDMRHTLTSPQPEIPVEPLMHGGRIEPSQATTTTFIISEALSFTTTLNTKNNTWNWKGTFWSLCPYSMALPESRNLLLKCNRRFLPQDHSRDISCYSVSVLKEAMLTYKYARKLMFLLNQPIVSPHSI